MDHWGRIANHIAETTGAAFTIRARTSVSGGCINRTFVIADNARRFFVKCNDAGRVSMFAAEARGLQELAAADAIRVPRPICWGEGADESYLVLEFIDFDRPRRDSAATLGLQLAALHAHTADRFGWIVDNTIGATPQINTPTDNWLEFWHWRRLAYQLQLAARHGYGGSLQRKGEQLLAALPQFFSDYQPRPSLLHGDLWTGNCGYDTSGAPVVFDPAVYYGDRETDIAMTELFGGLGTEFLSAYRSAAPLDVGYRTRKTLYNLYHILNHLNLFGDGYRTQAERMMDTLLTEVR